jgi:hypothetical protein
MSAWKRNWKWLLGVIIGAAVLKIIWSVAFSGESGMSILKPAILGLVICIGGLAYFFKRHKGKADAEEELPPRILLTRPRVLNSACRQSHPSKQPAPHTFPGTVITSENGAG